VIKNNLAVDERLEDADNLLRGSLSWFSGHSASCVLISLCEDVFDLVPRLSGRVLRLLLKRLIKYFLFWFNIFLTFSSKANQKIVKLKQGVIKTEILERISHLSFFLIFPNHHHKKNFLPNFRNHNRNIRYKEIFKTSTFILVE
jgi:hypothetical protein